MFHAVESSLDDLKKLGAPMPDAAWRLEDGTQCRASCSLWWTQTPVHAGQRLGLIGHYFAQGPEAALELLRLACRTLAAFGCTLAVGPMDGNTWKRYRFITERGSAPLFFLEPDNPDDYPGHFTIAGFTPLAHYYSAVTDDLTTEDPRLPVLATNAAREGIQIRNLRQNQFEKELLAIHSLSSESFRDNFLYTPISEPEFLDQYRALEPVVVAPLVFLAEKQGALIAFLFCIPDYRQKERGDHLDTVIVKTMATHPDHRGGGLGSLLIARCHEVARRLGFRRVIHALMHEGNHSRRISSHTARVFRRYTLLARPLDSMP